MTRTAYGELVRSFNHERLTTLPAYHALRQAISDISNQADPGEKVERFLADIRDMALTAPYGDSCQQCLRDSHDDGELCITWPCAATRNGDVIRGQYVCERGHSWSCSYHVDISAMFG